MNTTLQEVSVSIPIRDPLLEETRDECSRRSLNHEPILMSPIYFLFLFFKLDHVYKNPIKSFLMKKSIKLLDTSGSFDEKVRKTPFIPLCSIHRHNFCHETST